MSTATTTPTTTTTTTNSSNNTSATTPSRSSSSSSSSSKDTNVLTRLKLVAVDLTSTESMNASLVEIKSTIDYPIPTSDKRLLNITSFMDSHLKIIEMMGRDKDENGKAILDQHNFLPNSHAFTSYSEMMTYYRLIKHPLSISIIKNKLISGMYSESNELILRDFERLFTNAIKWKATNNDLRLFNQLLSNYCRRGFISQNGVNEKMAKLASFATKQELDIDYSYINNTQPKHGATLNNFNNNGISNNSSSGSTIPTKPTSATSGMSDSTLPTNKTVKSTSSTTSKTNKPVAKQKTTPLPKKTKAPKPSSTTPESASTTTPSATTQPTPNKTTIPSPSATTTQPLPTSSKTTSTSSTSSIPVSSATTTPTTSDIDTPLNDHIDGIEHMYDSSDSLYNNNNKNNNNNNNNNTLPRSTSKNKRSIDSSVETDFINVDDFLSTEQTSKKQKSDYDVEIIDSSNSTNGTNGTTNSNTNGTTNGNQQNNNNAQFQQQMNTQVQQINTQFQQFSTQFANITGQFSQLSNQNIVIMNILTKLSQAMETNSNSIKDIDERIATLEKNVQNSINNHPTTTPAPTTAPSPSMTSTNSILENKGESIKLLKSINEHVNKTEGKIQTIEARMKNVESEVQITSRQITNISNQQSTYTSEFMKLKEQQEQLNAQFKGITRLVFDGNGKITDTYQHVIEFSKTLKVTKK